MPNVSNDNSLSVALDTAGADANHAHEMQVGAVKFGWELSTNVQQLDGPQRKWRVSLCFTAEGKPPRTFRSTETDVEIGEEGIVSFFMETQQETSDEFSVHHFETVLSPVETAGSAVNGAAKEVQMRFRLEADNTAPRPRLLIIENTDITVFWIIGARSVVLTDR